MSETNDSTPQETQPSELDALKQIANNMEISYHPTIGIDKLREKIEEAKAKVAPKVVTAGLTEKAKQLNRFAEVRKTAMKLRRIRITCMNPNKREWPGEYFSISNKAIHAKRYVPYESEWHVEDCIYEMIKNRKYRTTIQKPDGKGGKIRENKILNEFAVELLPDLTKEELKALADDQRVRNAID